MAHFSDILGTLRTVFRIGKTTLDGSAQTAPRTLVLPDKSGTLATTADTSNATVSAARTLMLMGG